MDISRLIRYQKLRFKRLRGDPQYIAGGALIGLLVGLTPTLPFHILITLFFCFLLKRSTIAGVLVNWVVANPLTLPGIYYLDLYIGNKVTGYDVSWEQIQKALLIIENAETFTIICNTIAGIGLKTIFLMFTGSLVLAIPVGLLSYYPLLRGFMAINANKQKKT